MKKRACCCLLVVLVMCLISCGPDVGPPDEVAVLETSYGRFVIEFYPEYAPNHVATFKKLFRDGFFDETKIHRLLKEKGRPIAVQGGDPNTVNGDQATWGMGLPGQKTLRAEISDKLVHARGAVSAAHKPKEKDTAASQFFICVAAEPRFDGEYTIFGNVVEGMNVVDSIARAPLVKGTERPVDPVVVNRAYLAKRDEIK
ncbi:MAG TPA: peptidylprolyl isomerase [Blastocatellia bacterium]|nr:peptidylprolyl isomerase [Blastocatellia bacterium]